MGEVSLIIVSLSFYQVSIAYDIRILSLNGTCFSLVNFKTICLILPLKPEIRQLAVMEGFPSARRHQPLNLNQSSK